LCIALVVGACLVFGYFIFKQKNTQEHNRVGGGWVHVILSNCNDELMTH
jgi:hypothetical protein